MSLLTRKTARILSIDGGGIRGLIPATIIAEWEKTLGPIRNHFHLLAGTSTGGILAAGLAKGVPASKIVEFYRSNGPAIFSSSIAALGSVAGALYDAGALESAVKNVFGASALSDIAGDLLVTSYDIEARQPGIFKSWKARGYELAPSESAESNNFLLKDVCRATSAAPTYFTPARIENQGGKKFALIDGGVYANNPSMCAYVAARRLYPRASEYMIVSLGTGETAKPIKYDDALHFGVVGWAQPLLDILFDGVSSTTEYELAQLSGVSQYRFQASLAGASQSMDDASLGNMSALVTCGKNTLAKFSSDIGKLLGRLNTEHMSSLENLGYPAPGAPAKPFSPVTVAPTKTQSLLDWIKAEI